MIKASCLGHRGESKPQAQPQHLASQNASWSGNETESGEKLMGFGKVKASLWA